MRSTYKPFVWRSTRRANMSDCMNEWTYYLKCIIIVIFLLYFKKYLHSLIQSAVFTGSVCGLPNKLLVRTAHDCETGLF